MPCVFNNLSKNKLIEIEINVMLNVRRVHRFHFSIYLNCPFVFLFVQNVESMRAWAKNLFETNKKGHISQENFQYKKIKEKPQNIWG